MTPEAVEAVFYETYQEAMNYEPNQTIEQRRVRMKSWQAVIDHVEKPWKEAILKTIEGDAKCRA